MSDQTPAERPTNRTPRQRWGTCCPFDPNCEHSYLEDDALMRWVDTPITDDQAEEMTA